MTFFGTEIEWKLGKKIKEPVHRRNTLRNKSLNEWENFPSNRFQWKTHMVSWCGKTTFKFVVHEKNYSQDCMAGEDDGKSGYFQCAVHLPVDKMKLTQ